MNNLINEGNRNDEMTKRCGYLFNKYKPHEVYSMMLKINQRCCLPPLSEKEVTQILNPSVEGKQDNGCIKRVE